MTLPGSTYNYFKKLIFVYFMYVFLFYFVGSSGASRKKATIEVDVVMIIIGLTTEIFFT